MLSIQDIIQIILNPPFIHTQGFLILKLIMLALSVFFMLIIFFVLAKTDWLDILMLQDFKEVLSYKHFVVATGIEKKWRKIKDRIRAASEAEARLIVIEADDFLNEILKKIGFGGNTFEERLSKITAEALSNVEEVKKAHQIRCKLVKDPNYHVDMETIKKMMQIYEEALVDLNAF